MKKISSIFILLLSLILISCNKNQKREKDTILLAAENSASIDTTNIIFKIYSDSSYTFNVKKRELIIIKRKTITEKFRLRMIV